MHKENNGLLVAYRLDGAGAGTLLDWEALSRWRPGDGFLWLHWDFSHPAAKKWLMQKSGLKPVVSTALTLEESRPRAEVDPEGLLLFLRGVNLNPGQDPEDMVSIRMWADKHRVITTARRQLLTIQDMCHAIEAGQAPMTASAFVVRLTECLTDRMSDVVEGISDALDGQEEVERPGTTAELRHAISEIRRQSIMIRRYLSPQRDALNRLLVGTSTFLTPVDLLQLREVSDRNQRYIEELDSVRDRAAVIHEEISTRLSEQINNRMYLLSLVAVVFLPLGFITGLLGVNLGGIPGGQNPYAFWWLLLLLLLFGGLLLWVFRYKKWI